MLEKLVTISVGVVAVTAAAIYSLGLIAVAVPLSRTCTNDYSTAWYAAALVPRTVVAGQGVRQLLVGPLAFLLMTASLMLVGGIAYKYVRIVFETFSVRRIVSALLSALALILNLVIVVGALYNLATGTQAATTLHVAPSMYRTILTIGAIFLPALIGLPLGLRMVRALKFPPDVVLPRVANRSALWRAALIGGIVALAAGFVVAAFRPPPLPRVELNGADPPQNGSLLAHTESFWYVFGEKGVLRATPDDKIDGARVLSKQHSVC